MHLQRPDTKGSRSPFLLGEAGGEEKASKDRKKETLKARYDGVVEFDQDKAVECPVPEGLQ